MLDHLMSIYETAKDHDDEIMRRRPDGTPRAGWRMENPAPVRTAFRVVNNGKSFSGRVNIDTKPVFEIWTDAEKPRRIAIIDLKSIEAVELLAPYALPADNDMKGYEFKAIREGFGMTQKQLAPLLDYAAAIRISELESGARPVPTHVARLMRAYQAGYRPSDWPK